MPAPRSRATTRAALDRLRREVASDRYVQSVTIADRLKAWLEEPQRDVIDDPSTRKALRTARQVGKTSTATSYIYDTCLRKKDAVVVAIELTLKVAKGLLWRPLKRTAREYGIDVAWNNSDLIATFPGTNAIAIIGGAETEADIEKYRGLTADLFVIDEAKSFPQQLIDALIEEVVKPALLHRKGTLLMMGTPGSVFAGEFHRVTGPDSQRIMSFGDERRAVARPYRERRDPRWKGVAFEYSFHTWKFADLKGKWARDAEKEAAKQIREAGYSDDNPIKRREWDGEWTPDDSKQVYHFDAVKNTWKPGPKSDENPFGLPGAHEWRYVIGCDLGWNDPFAIEVVAYSDTHPAVYQVWEYEQTEINVSAQAAALQNAVAECGGIDNVEAIVGDFEGGASKAIQSTLAEEHDLPVEMAAKSEKRDHIAFLNSDFLEGRAFVKEKSQLAEEMPHVQWDPKRPDKERSGTKNNRTDAFLYATRKARHHEAKPAEAKPAAGSAEEKAERIRAEMARHIAKQRRATDDDNDTLGAEDAEEWTTDDGGIDGW